MKILLISREIPPYNTTGGISFYMNDLKTNFESFGNDVFVITEVHEKNVQKIKNVETVFIPQYYVLQTYFPFLYALYFSLRIYFKVKRIKPDIIETHEWYFPAFFSLLFKLKIPIIIRIHGWYKKSIGNGALGINTKIFETLESYCMQKASVLTFPDISIKNLLESSYLTARNEKYRIIPNGIDTSLFKPHNIKRKDKSIIFIFTGRIEDRKNIALLIEEFAIINKEIPDSKLMLVGKIHDEQNTHYLNLIKKYKLKKSIVYTGSLPRNELPRIYSSADIFITASLFETVGLNAYEAMSCALPVIGYKDVLPDFVTTAKLGVIATSQEKRELAKAAIQAIKNEPKEMGKKARVYIEKHFSPTLRTKETLSLYQDILDGKAFK